MDMREHASQCKRHGTPIGRRRSTGPRPRRCGPCHCWCVGFFLWISECEDLGDPALVLCPCRAARFPANLCRRSPEISYALFLNPDLRGTYLGPCVVWKLRLESD